jgi:L-lactate dehydrogenase complex protein LldG
MTTEDRDLILSSIELALGYPPREKTLTEGAKGEDIPQFLPSDSPWDPFREALEELSGVFHLAQDRETAQRHILSIIDQHGVKKAAIWRDAVLDSLGVTEILHRQQVAFNPPSMKEGEFRRWCAEAELGITSAQAVLVESGTIVLCSGPQRERSVSLLPPVHLAIIPPQYRMESILELPRLLRHWMTEEKGRAHRTVYTITGPSRTADIALQLVLGAHGPRALNVIGLSP